MSIEQKMNKTIESIKNTLSSIRTNRANPELLKNVVVDYYGSKVPLSQVASVSVPEPMTLQLNIFDQNAIKDVEKAILSSQLNLTPQVDSTIIRINLPELTEERRNDLVKLIKKHGEDAKVALRNIRRDEIDTLKTQEKNNEITEDDLKKETQATQNITDAKISLIDKLLVEKEKEILTI